MQVFQVVPPILRDVGRGLEIDVDFAESLKIYLDHFDSFSIACPVRCSNITGSGLERCQPIADLPWGSDRLKFIPLPAVYTPLAFARSLRHVRPVLRAEVSSADYLIFTPYSLIGDWPTVAIREAVALGRRYVIEADGVHGNIMRMDARRVGGWRRFVKSSILFPLFDRSYEYCLRHSSLAVFQGQDVYDAYSSFCSNPYKINHHIPVYPGDHITTDELMAKLTSVKNSERLRICYAGRAVDMKGPFDWVDTLHCLQSRGVQFEAIWLGDGPLLPEMRAKAASLGIRHAAFPGYVSDRYALLKVLKESHMFLFCHTTLESARILGEALASGCPLVGYRSSYPCDLVRRHGGGAFSEMGDYTGLAEIVHTFDKERDKLSTLIMEAARSGRDFNRPAALKERAMLVQRQSNSSQRPSAYESTFDGSAHTTE